MKHSRAERRCAICAGEINQIKWDSDRWVYLDIGFSSSKKTCGIAFGDDEPTIIHFGEVNAKIIEFAGTAKTPINLVIEAPLSVAFAPKGNPAGRCFEKKNGDHRYWYVGAGCSTMVAAIYLVRQLANERIKVDIRLFEGFASFKNNKKKSNGNSHIEDVKKLRGAVFKKKEQCFCDLTGKDYKSSFEVLGLDFGVPPVIVI